MILIDKLQLFLCLQHFVGVFVVSPPPPNSPSSLSVQITANKIREGATGGEKVWQQWVGGLKCQMV